MWFQIHSLSFCSLKLVMSRSLFRSPRPVPVTGLCLCFLYYVFNRLPFVRNFSICSLNVCLLKENRKRVEIAFWSDLWRSRIKLSFYPKGYNNKSQTGLATHQHCPSLPAAPHLFNPSLLLSPSTPWVSAYMRKVLQHLPSASINYLTLSFKQDQFDLKKWGTAAEGIWVMCPGLQQRYLAELEIGQALWWQIHQKSNQVGPGRWGPLLPARGLLPPHGRHKPQTGPFSTLPGSPLRQRCVVGTVSADLGAWRFGVWLLVQLLAGNFWASMCLAAKRR